MTDDDIEKLIEAKLVEHSKMMGEVVQKRMAGQEARAKEYDEKICATMAEVNAAMAKGHATMATVITLLRDLRGDVEPATAPPRLQ